MAERSEWTIESLRAYFEALLVQRSKHYDDKFSLLQTTTADTMRALERSSHDQFMAQKELVNQALVAATTAVNKAETAAEKRFDAVNEFRNTLADQQRTLMPRAEAEVRINSIDAKIDELMRSIREMRSVRFGESNGWGWAIGVVALVAAIMGIVFQFRR